MKNIEIKIKVYHILGDVKNLTKIVILIWVGS